MSDDRRSEVRITLLLRFEAEDVTGEVGGPDGAVAPFMGWPGLLARLARLAHADAGEPPGLTTTDRATEP